MPEPAIAGAVGAYRLMETSFDHSATWRLAQTTPVPGSPGTGTPRSEPAAHEASASELNKQLSNPVTSLWSLAVKVQLAGQYMPIRPDNVGQEWNVQLQQLTPVIPKLIKDPIFH